MDSFISNRADKEDLIWGLAATGGTMSMPHIDDSGLAVVSTIMSGSKWWVVMRRHENVEEEDHRGDIFSTHAFPLSWGACSTGKGFLQAEAIHLKTGDIL